MSPASNPTFSVTHEACQRIIRNPATGGATASNVSYINAGGALISGVDLSATWQADLSDMGFDAHAGNVLRELPASARCSISRRKRRPRRPSSTGRARSGPDPGTSLNNGAYDYRTFTTFNYAFNDWSMSLRWRHLPSAKSALQAALDSTTGGTATVLGAEDSYDVFDLSASWGFGERTTLRMGVDNCSTRTP